MRFTKSVCVDRKFWNALLDQEVLDGAYAPFRKRLVVLVSTAWIGMAGEGQARVRLNLQVRLEVRCQGSENLILAVCQALIRTLHVRQSSREETLCSKRFGGGGGGGGGGAWILTLVLHVAVCPLSSVTVPVICTGPLEAPVEEYVAVDPLPLMVPPEAW